MTEPGETTPPLRRAVGRAGKAVQKTMRKNASTKTAESASTQKPTKKTPSGQSKTKKTGAKGQAAAAQAGKATATRARTKSAARKPGGEVPPVPEGTDWSPAELAEVRAELEAQVDELRAEYDRALVELSNLQQTSNDGAGDDQADAGTKTFEREQEMSIAHNRLDLLTQMERALVRLRAGTYGRCESCGDAIAKARLQAFPSATLCVQCKQREERR
jgi:DnaK suppressor protein